MELEQQVAALQTKNEEEGKTVGRLKHVLMVSGSLTPPFLSFLPRTDRTPLPSPPTD